MAKYPKDDPIRYVTSNDPNASTGIIYVVYTDDDKKKRKSFSWHYCGKRTHDEAKAEAIDFLKSIGQYNGN